MNKYDVIVVGAGHAGLEAAFSCANLRQKVALFTINKEFVANTPCNPSIGGPAKGIVVREIDALGGMQAKAADANQLQMKILNAAKGAGVWALRAQIDKISYHEWFMNEIKINKNITLIEKEVIELIVKKQQIYGVKTLDEQIYEAKAVILTTGTFLKSITHIGNIKKHEGPNGQKTSNFLSASLQKNGFELIRLKTGTPARIKKDTIDYQNMQIETGTNKKLSFAHFKPLYLDFNKQIPCYLIHTNVAMHELIKANLHRSAMYSGQISGIGPRYCPSIEDKVIRFSDKLRHQIFVEPESLLLDTMYLQGLSTSLDHKIQDELIHMLPGFENAVIDKYAYAIEYDAINPTQLHLTYESKKIKNLFFAGQINGTSGYEEAAGQGLMAGINASMNILNKPQLILKRNESYIGVMTDDLMTKGVNDPYRLLTSRAEHRLYLRNDNAQDRLIKYGRDIGLINDDVFNEYLLVQQQVELIMKHLKNNKVSAYKLLCDEYKCPSYNLLKLAKRPEVDLEKILKLTSSDNFKQEAIDKANINIKFEGYIINQTKNINKMNRLQNTDLTQILDYKIVPNLSLEARDKFNRIKPINLDQASRISGINLIDLSIVKYYIDNIKENK